METIKNWLEARKKDDKAIVLLLIKGYFLLTVLCFGFLVLPICQSSENSIVDHIFFAVSIVSTTGLAPADFTGSYNFFGQIIN